MTIASYMNVCARLCVCVQANPVRGGPERLRPINWQREGGGVGGIRGIRFGKKELVFDAQECSLPVCEWPMRALLCANERIRGRRISGAGSTPERCANWPNQQLLVWPR